MYKFLFTLNSIWLNNLMLIEGYLPYLPVLIDLFK